MEGKKIQQAPGIICPTITFFNENFKTNDDLNSLLYQHVLLNSNNGLLLFGVTGEGPYFKDRINEKIKCIDLAKVTRKNQCPITVGIFGNTINEILNEIEEIGNIHKDISFMISLPLETKIAEEELGNYFENILGSAGVNNPIYLYNNPPLFHGVEIKPDLLDKLIDFPNLKGIIESSEKISKYIAYLNYIGEDFYLYCGKERIFSTFLQLIPSELRKFCGLIPSIANITNCCSQIYNAALAENTLELIKLHDELNENRVKIYDTQVELGKTQRGLKTAFFALYKDIINYSFNEVINVAPQLARELEDFTYDRIKVTMHALINDKKINKFYPIGENLYNMKEFKEIFSHLLSLGDLTKIKGPYGGKINTIYRLKFEENDVVFRTRTSKAFRYEDIIKEKVLFPFLDGTLSYDTPDLREKIKEILVTKTGSYFFSNQKPPIISVGELVYYDETKETFPEIYALQKFISGKPLNFILKKYQSEGKILNSNSLIKLFNLLGETLGKLHKIKFDRFYNTITEIGIEKQRDFQIKFNKELDYELQEAKKNKLDDIKGIKTYFKDNSSLIEEENEPVLFHNDFQAQNIIVREEPTLQFRGLIDFDNWQIGVRPQDFVKIEYWTLKPLNEPALNESFYNGYKNLYERPIDSDFKKRIEIYSLLWFIKVYNFEIEKIKRGEKNILEDQRFPTATTYVEEIMRILNS